MIRDHTPTQPLLNLSRSSPPYGPHPDVQSALARLCITPTASQYTPREGLQELRQSFAIHLSDDYAGTVEPDQVIITAGCNQAFAAIVSALSHVGDEVILTDPYYSNHAMWLRIEGVKPVFLTIHPDGLPDPSRAQSLITNRTRAIVLVTPANPTGMTLPPELIRDFADLAEDNNIFLILDETYRLFRESADPPHDLYARTGWSDSTLSVYSFSKDFALPGFRVGAAVGNPVLLDEALKIISCIAICAPRLGQVAALSALEADPQWLEQRREDVRGARTAFAHWMNEIQPAKFEFVSSGAFFAWLRHSYDGERSEVVAQQLLLQQDVACVPGAAFTTTDDQYLRLSIAGLASDNAHDLMLRLNRGIDI